MATLSIRRLILKALETGWLSLEIEYQLKELLDFEKDISVEDLELLSELQQAVEEGKVQREKIKILRDSQMSLKNFQVA
jgi:hypothetical protein